MSFSQRFKSAASILMLCVLSGAGLALGGKIIMRREPPPNGPLDPRYAGPSLRPKYLDTRPSHQEPKEPTEKQFMDAFLGRGREALVGGEDELRGNIFTLATNGSNTEPGASIRNSKLTGEGRVRIEIADEETLRLLVAGGGWDVQLSQTEGAYGSVFSNPPNQQTFTVPRIRIPVKGKVIALGSLSAYAHLFNNTGGPPAIYKISFAIIPGRAIEDNQIFENNSGGAAQIAELSHHFSVSVPGGVQVGDTIEVRSYAGGLLKTYPAREGGVWAVGIQDATVTYVTAAGVVSQLVWTFYRTV